MLIDVNRLSASVDDLLAGAERREPFVNPDGRSTAAFERVWIDGRPHVVKYMHLDDDFAMRASGDVGCRAARAWAAGLLDARPDLIDHAVVGAALGQGRNGWGAALLMRDVSADLLPDDGSVLPLALHDRFIDHVAGFSAATWGFHDDGVSGLVPYATRWAFFGVDAIDAEREIGWRERVPEIAAEGWTRFANLVPADVFEVVDALRRDVFPLADALEQTPSCLLHGDVKASNTGADADGRTVLIDWAYVGEGPVCHDIAWHLALDRARLPRSKEATAEEFRRALEGHGVDTSGWWDRQLGLCLLGGLVQFGWEKALGDTVELDWWCQVARAGAAYL